MPSWDSIMFTDAISPIMIKMIKFHDHTMMVMTMVMLFLIYMMLLTNKYSVYSLTSHHDLEIIWTCLPTLLLVMIALPSLHVLYLSDESLSPMMNIKVIGNQWYWSYEYSDSFVLDSYMSQMSIMRLLDTDDYPVLIVNVMVNILVTSNDVIHSWTVPSTGLKVDAVPGRVNLVSMFINRPGVYYGQCSEICGLYHSFMPIMLEVIWQDFSV